jgi:ribosomal protein S18 acetylase RimI-like enzyme
LTRCEESNGQAFVAVYDGEVVGLIAVLAAEPFTELDDPPGTYGLVTDLVVLARCRGQGIGRMLLSQAETFARAAGAAELRIGVLAANDRARRLYVDGGFMPHSEILTKRLSPK